MSKRNPLEEIIGDVLAGSVAALLTPRTSECEALANYVADRLKKSQPKYAILCDQVVAANGRSAKLAALENLRADMPGDMTDPWVGSVDIACLEVRASLREGRTWCTVKWGR
jgi:hypothetical protein